MYGQFKILQSASALAQTDERTFPASRNRSKRIHKKLVKRFGGEFRQVPCIWQMGDTLVAHPALFHQVCAKFEARV